MKRDPELIRKLILAIEDLPGGTVPNDFMSYFMDDGYTYEQLGYHNFLVCDAGLAEGEDLTDERQYLTHEGSYSPFWVINNLTWAGHDFADNLRNETIWKQVRTKIANTGGSASVEVMIELAKQAAKNLFSL